MLNWLLVNLLLCFYYSTVLAQTDTLFWFAAPEVTVSERNFDKPIVCRLSSYSAPSTVTISQPANPNFPPQTVVLNAESSQTIDLTNWIDVIENKPANTVLNYGLKISASAPITAYYEVVSSQCLCNPEIFVLKGQNGLGKDFWIPSQNKFTNSTKYLPTPYASFDIVATAHNTEITINPSSRLIGHTSTDPFTIILNQGQTYSAAAVGIEASNRLGGSKVTSNKPIAVTVKDDLVTGLPSGPCADLGGDQLVPASFLGKEFVLINSFLTSTTDPAYILATHDGTVINQNGNYLNTIDAGETLPITIGGFSTYIDTSDPVSVLQISGIDCEIGIAVLPSIFCTGSQKVSLTRSSNEPFYINVLVPKGGENTFSVNGNSGVLTANLFESVPGTDGEWLAAQLNLTSGSYPVNESTVVTNSTDLFHLSVIHGDERTGVRFGYFSNFADLKAEASINETQLCTGETIELSVEPIPDASYSWTGPNNYSANIPSPTIPDVQVQNSGDYIIQISTPNCPVESDTVTVAIYPTSSDSIKVAICEGEKHELPDGIIVSESGSYISTVESALGCDSLVNTTVALDSCNTCYYITPNAFSPNGDGMNDTFGTYSSCPIQNYHLQVYNRWGQIVFETMDINEQWDGFHKEVACLLGVYVWVCVIDSEDVGRQTTKGNLTLIR